MSGITGIHDDEAVTHALVRDVTLPGEAGTMALITLDNGFDHTKPNTFGPRGLTELDEALDAICERSDLAAVGVTGKPFIFAVGADLTGAARVRTRAQAEEIGRLGHEVFRRLGELEVPSFAFVNGAAMGGGLEIALHCTYRTISSGVPAVALPECFLGLVPGWGGTQLLPRLIGPANALKLIIENPLSQNKMIKGTEAFKLGVADAVFEPADFLEESLSWASRVLTGEAAVPRPPFTEDAGSWEAAVAGARALVDMKLHGASPAPYRALELVELARTAPRDQGFEAETQALADLLTGDELRAGLYSFDLVQRRAKRPAGAPDRALARTITKVGVVGAGLMASQLALLFARRLQVPVVLTDLDQARLDKGVAYVHAEIARLLAKGRIGADTANRLTGLVTGSLTKDAFADAELVIEAVFEDLKVKRQVLSEVEAVVRPECVLATNTSSLSVTAMAAELRHPERVVGLHFFNPVAVLPLLEVVRGERTDDASLATAFAVGKALRKSGVLVKDAPAFVVNRLLTRFMGEVIGAVDEGTPIETADHALDGLGLPMTPFTLLQLVGPAVGLHVAETLHEAFPGRYKVSASLANLVKAGKPGVYAPDFTIDPEAREIFESQTIGTAGPDAEQVRQRALGALAEEVRLMLDEGVVAAAEDIDLCMILGAGWPFHTGGITPYLDRTGVSEKVTGRRFLAPGVASVPD
ncbi:3-hydroxyacyl-CoA dehydrogenase NAD-binding domain-containing protein [Sphaerisporangium corydalis]|uniref:3-hydroxyacyl-CoA dehydrogenase NAD-binding domain-containing protein n=1 Tax=Sphaerisporangium corydalis TaxID=1441875 RepID=A0ABV9EQ87_9ACTN|nr:3-hydroxyacyl-CoA dehydrogenase NAD-binding domain-containing protein [Sphaerisporangium corydalis]